MKSKHFGRWLGFGLLGVALIFFFSLTVGAKFISPWELFKIIFGQEEGAVKNVFLYSRLPRALGAFLAGMALSLSGGILQNVLQNPLASPSVIGVNAGAGLGVTVACAFSLLSSVFVSLFAFMGSLLAILFITLFAGKTRASRTTVILCGVALNSIFGAVNEAIAVMDPDVAALTVEFRVGGFSAVTYSQLLPGGVGILLCVLLLSTLHNELDLVAMGDENALSLGMNVKKYRILFLVLSALLSGLAVSFSGLLGFVGLIVPHAVKKLFGGESRHFLPLSAILGGGFVLLADTLSRLIFLPYEVPVGILMAVLGGPVFLVLLCQMRGGHRHA